MHVSFLELLFCQDNLNQLCIYINWLEPIKPEILTWNFVRFVGKISVIKLNAHNFFYSVCSINAKAAESIKLFYEGSL